MEAKLLKRHIEHNNQIRCVYCEENLLLGEPIYVDIAHTMTHQRCGHYLKLKDKGTLTSVALK
ncbi:hypothetical protein AB3U99_03790 [Niallia sp. JL1B1071]|uniref:hypothetical protein n=1 Tax=Niallia tiangongensis TaxID=3237105 RepID=UPI0037DCC77E